MSSRRLDDSRNEDVLVSHDIGIRRDRLRDDGGVSIAFKDTVKSAVKLDATILTTVTMQ